MTTTGPITYAEMVTLYGEPMAYAYLQVIERNAAQQGAHHGNTTGAHIIPFDRNARLQQAFAIWSAAA